MSRLRVNRTSQPQQPAIIATRRPPSFVWTPPSGVSREVITGRVANLASGGAPLLTTGPLGLAGRGGSNRAARFPSTGYAGSTNYTVMAVLIDDTGRGTIRNPFDSDDAGTARIFQFRLTASNAVELITFDTASAPYTITGSTATSATDKSVIFGRINNNALSVWLNGRQDATGSAGGTANTIQTSGAVLSVGAFAQASSYFNGFGGQIYLCAHWPFALSDAEIVSISANPWQIFTPEPRRLWTAPAVGGAGTGTLTATESGSDGATLSGAVLAQGALTAAETGADAAAMSAAVQVQATLASIETGSDAFAASGLSSAGGTLAATETGADLAALTGIALVQGALASTESGIDTFAATGTAPAAGTGTLTVSETGADTASLAGLLLAQGSSAAVETGADAATLTGSLLVQGLLAAAESGADTFAGSQGAGIYVPSPTVYSSAVRLSSYSSPARASSYSSAIRP